MSQGPRFWLRHVLSSKKLTAIFIVSFIIFFVLSGIGLYLFEGSDAALLVKGAQAVCNHEGVYAPGPLEQYNPRNPRDHNKYFYGVYSLLSVFDCMSEKTAWIPYVVSAVLVFIAGALNGFVWGRVFMRAFGVPPERYIWYAPLWLVSGGIAGTIGFLNIDPLLIFMLGVTLNLVFDNKWGWAGFFGVTLMVLTKYHFLGVFSFLLPALLFAFRVQRQPEYLLRGMWQMFCGVCIGIMLAVLIAVSTTNDFQFGFSQIGDQVRFTRQFITNMKYYPPGSKWKATEVNGLIQITLAHGGWEGLTTVDPIFHKSRNQWIVEGLLLVIWLSAVWELWHVVKNLHHTDLGVWLAWGIGIWFRIMLTLPQLEYTNLTPAVAILMLTIPMLHQFRPNFNLSGTEIIQPTQDVSKRRLGYLLYLQIFGWVPTIIYYILEQLDMADYWSRVFFDWESSSLLTISAAVSIILLMVYGRWRTAALRDGLIQPTTLSSPQTLLSIGQPQSAEVPTVG